MAIEIKVPSLGESVTDATVAKWLKQPGEPVAVDEPVVELETDKVNVEVPAPVAGTLAEIVAAEGITLPVGAVLGIIGDGAVAVPAAHPTPLEASLPLPGEQDAAIAAPEPAGAGHVAALDRSGPAVRKLVAESGLDARDDHADRARSSAHQSRCDGRGGAPSGGAGDDDPPVTRRVSTGGQDTAPVSAAPVSAVPVSAAALSAGAGG